MNANFPDYFKMVRIFPVDCQFSGLFQNCLDFSRWMPILRMISKLSDFSRWLPIFRMISKLFGFFQMNANFPDYFKSVLIVQMTANFPDYFKTVRIFPDDCQFSGQVMLTPNALILGRRGYKNSDDKNCAKYSQFWSKTPFSHILAIFVPFYGLLRPFFIGPRSDHSLPMSLTNWLTHSLTNKLVEDWMN